jgi:hypothetical protein
LSANRIAQGTSPRRDASSLPGPDVDVNQGVSAGVVRGAARPTKGAFMSAKLTEKFRPGQVVRLSQSHYRTNTSGEYKIVRALPSEGRGELEYRVKGLSEPYERVVRESEIQEA